MRERTVLVEGDVGLVFATTDLRFAAPNEPRREGRQRMLVLQMQQRSRK